MEMLIEEPKTDQAEKLNMLDILKEILKAMVERDASDVYFKVGSPPMLRIAGQLFSVKMDSLSPEQTESLAMQIMNNTQKASFEDRPEVNMIYSLSGVGRFRVNIYRQRGSVGMVMRKVRTDIQGLEELKLPEVLKSLCMNQRGLVLLVGPTGSGKSTTLAAMVDYVNNNRTGHILTIEDPIEFLHQDHKCIVSQREIGTDTNNWGDALKNAVRQAPDIVLIGEMRDKESVESAVFMAETGHLVMSTLHSNNASQAVERVISFFPQEQHAEIFLQLSLNMRGVVSQRLVPRADGNGRAVAVEVLVFNARVRELTRGGDLTQIKREIDFFHTEGMQSIDMALFKLYQEGAITLESALASADNPNDLRLKIKTAPKKPVDTRGQLAGTQP
ncbi:MAG: PilT/PilU family type 4a pilus ATPase [Armatimonadetes bacterium]|nr:PilT/PilU family type 4a pilus ATPase [Armatimonadota bacterium]